MKARILGISGPVAAGKSALSKRIADRLGWKVIRSGRVLQKEASRLGLDSQARRVLQDLGHKYIHEERDFFCRKLLESVDWSSGEDVIIDAIRHVEAIDALKQLTAPSVFRLLYLDLNKSVRRKQLSKRGETVSIEEVESHPVESQVYTTLPKLADYVVDGSIQKEKLVAQVVSWVLISFEDAESR